MPIIKGQTKLKAIHKGSSDIVRVYKGTKMIAGYLPSTFQRVEYIESTGTQYIETNFYPTSNTRVEATLYTTQTGNKNWFGAGSLNPAFVFNSRSENKIEYNFGNSGWENVDTPYPVVLRKFTVSFSKSGILIDGIDTGAILPQDTFTSTLSLNIFIRNGGSAYISAKLYSFKIYERDQLIRDYVPCYRRNDNVVGLYDLINGVFYTNAGTGTFLKGSDI